MQSSAEDGSASLPMPVQTAAMINGKRTEIILTEFSDQIFIVITQFDKLGPMVSPSLIALPDDDNISFRLSFLPVSYSGYL